MTVGLYRDHNVTSRIPKFSQQSITENGKKNSGFTTANSCVNLFFCFFYFWSGKREHESENNNDINNNKNNGKN